MKAKVTVSNATTHNTYALTKKSFSKALDEFLSATKKISFYTKSIALNVFFLENTFLYTVSTDNGVNYLDFKKVGRPYLHKLNLLEKEGYDWVIKDSVLRVMEKNIREVMRVCADTHSEYIVRITMERFLREASFGII